MWGIANMITGWAINMFGWFGQPAEMHNVKRPVLNYLGVACCILCVFISSFVKNDNDDKKNLQPKNTSYASNLGSAAPSPTPTATRYCILSSIYNKIPKEKHRSVEDWTRVFKE